MECIHAMRYTQPLLDLGGCLTPSTKHSMESVALFVLKRTSVCPRVYSMFMRTDIFWRQY